MKQRGRFIAVLAVLGLLLAMFSIAPAAGAVAGTVAITGGVTTDSVQWFSTNTGKNIATISVTDADKNVLTEVVGTCTSGALVGFKCTLVGVAGGTTYQMNHTYLEDANQDDIPDGVLIRALQGTTPAFTGTSGFITSGTSAATGAVVLTSALGTAVAATPVAATSFGPVDVLQTAFDITNYAKVRAVVTSNASGVLATNGIRIRGTSVNAMTLAETASDSEIVLTGTVADGSYDTTKYWKAGTTSFDVDFTSGSFTLALQELGTVAARYKYNQSDTITGRVTLVSSSHSAAPIALTLNETNPSSGIFAATATLTSTIGQHSTFSGVHTGSANASSLTDSAASFVNDGVLVGDVVNNTTDGSTGTVTARTATTITATLSGGTENDWDVNDAYTIPGRKKVYVTDGALLTFTYNDEDPVGAIVKTARADLKAPTIELVGPTHDSYTNVSALTFVVKVTDEASADSKASGLTTTDVDEIIVAGVSSGALAPLSIGTNSLQVSYSKTITSEGLTNWWFPVKDKVGNTPVFIVTTPATAILGAGDPSTANNQLTQPAKPFKVTIDTAAPTVNTMTVQTGGKLTTATTTPFATTWGAAADQRKNVTVDFNLGTGTAPLDPASLVASAWRVGGTAPSSAAMDTTGDTVVLTMGADQATDAAPKVELVTAGLKDKAGNTMATLTGTAAPTAADKLKPVLDVSVSPANTKTKVTITVTSSETLNAAPTVTVGTKLETNGTITENASTPTATQTTTINSWTAEFTAPATKATKRWVLVSGNDIGNNQEVRGEGTPSTDVVTFQVDTVAPLATVTTAPGDEGENFIRIVFDENEGYSCTAGNVADATHPCSGLTAGKARGDSSASSYTDAYKKVTLTKATLTNKTTLVEETVTTSFYTKDSIEYTLVKNLAKATYTLKLEFADEAANAGTKTQDITVTARAKTVINLTPGMNFFSLPGDALSSGINDIIGSGVAIDLVVGYDPTATNPWLTSVRDSTTGLFVGDLTSLEAGRGYIARATAFVDLEVDIPTAAYSQLPGVTMVKGNAWSLIGPATRTAGATVVDADDYLAGTSWSVCVTYNPDPNAADKGWTSVRPDTTTVTANNLKVERAYFCWFQADGTIVQQ